ncbi:MAG: hypothetical protein ACE5EN_01340 [Nitrospinota bacterium]
MKINAGLLAFLSVIGLFFFTAVSAEARTAPHRKNDKFLSTSFITNSEIRYLPGLSVTLKKLNAALMSGDNLAVSRNVEAVIKKKKRLESKNLFFVSRFLLAIAAQLERSGNVKRARDTARDAVEVSPDDYKTLLALSRYSFMADKSRLKSYLKPLPFAAIAYFKDSYNLLQLLNRVLKYLVPALVVAYALFAFTGLAVSLKPLAGDMSRVIGMDQKSATLAIVFVILAVLSAGGIFVLALAAPILSWGYLKAGGRKTTIGLVIFLALLPFIVEMEGRTLATENSRLYNAAHDYTSGNWEPESVKTLIRASRKKPDDTELWFALANLYRRAGDAEGAQKFLDRVLAKDSANVKAINEMANLRFQNKQFKEAELLYKKALNINSDHAELHYNMNKTYLELFRTEKAATEFNIAMQLDREKTEGFVRQADDNETTKVVSFVANLKSMPLMEKEIGDASRVEADRIWSAAAGNIDRNTYLAGAAAYLLLFAVVGGLWRRAERYTLCSSCGDAFLPAIRSPGQEEYRCNPCVVLSSTRKRVDKAKKVKKLGQIKKYHFNNRRKSNLLNYLLPGLGNVYFHSYRSGIIFLSVTSIFIVKILFILSPLLAEYYSALKAPVFEYIVWGTAMVVYYLLSTLMLRRAA